MRTLALDIGNTQIKAGLFEEGNLLRQEVITAEGIISYATEHHVAGIVHSSVSTDIKNVLEKLPEGIKQLQLTPQTITPLKNTYATPETLGMDRLAAAVGAWDLFPNENSIVIDVGTCMTIDLVSKEGTFIGGIISPGLQMRLDAMHHFTQALPHLQATNNSPYIGRSTEECMQTGAYHGMRLEIEGTIATLESEVGDCRKLLTGGNAPYFESNLKGHIFANLSLVLTGLNRILQEHIDNGNLR